MVIDWLIPVFGPPFGPISADHEKAFATENVSLTRSKRPVEVGASLEYQEEVGATSFELRLACHAIRIKQKGRHCAGLG